eukprot:CAMPEP_0114172398 /NCGR_PEP_ID=MMETSP0043_2-20121206/35263_1 /TAXON_ID=464988 /ORGANISM="Hemiselmis andersenii, Strain CCMP644" /LENGTH=133 /DNA_ID=CAMNT_0001270289 /DNA_START=235 /DNA_END=636 /DNA_ORIENTATION=+
MERVGEQPVPLTEREKFLCKMQERRAKQQEREKVMEHVWEQRHKAEARQTQHRRSLGESKSGQKPAQPKRWSPHDGTRRTYQQALDASKPLHWNWVEKAKKFVNKRASTQSDDAQETTPSATDSSPGNSEDRD